MKTFSFSILLLCLGTVVFGQSGISYKKEIKAYQAKQNQKFKDQRTSPLKEKDRLEFEKLEFYCPKHLYRVVAKFVRTSGSEPFEMVTTTDRKPIYEKYGELHFEIKGKTLQLNVYQSHDLRRNPLYRSSLFLPFKDLTNDKKSYVGGRFIDLKVPSGDTIIIDFNKAYNPDCAYNEKYSCPIVPAENYLKVRIKAGVMANKAISL